MDKFIARQPILATDKSLFAYEILSRFGPEDYCRAPSGEAATVGALDEMFVTGLKQLTSGMPAFVNCNRDFLVRDYLELLPRDGVVGEILETVPPDEEVLAACRRLKEKGYRLALDDYEGSPLAEPFLELVDFVKVDFLLTTVEAQESFARRFVQAGIPLVAEKVETLEQFRMAADMGYRYFQGYFFCRPQMLSRREVPPNRVVYLRILQALSQSHLDLEKVASLIKQEPSLSYRLLRYLNSPIFPVVYEVRSIPQALSLLGERLSRKWLAVVCVASMAENKPGELVKVSLTRARLCELLAAPVGMAEEGNELFLMGLLSAMNALLDLPMEEVLTKLPVDIRIKNALNGQPSQFLPILDVALQYESGNWDRLERSSRLAGVDASVMPDIYLEALAWGDQILSGAPAPSKV